MSLYTEHLNILNSVSVETIECRNSKMLQQVFEVLSFGLES